MKTKRGLRTKIGVLIMVSAVAGLVVWATTAQTPPLLFVSKLISVPKPLGTRPDELVSWLSENERLVQSNSNSKGKNHWDIDRLDIRTGLRQPLKPLAKLFEETTAYSPTVSPNGEWIQWIAGDGHDHIARLDKSNHIVWPNKSNVGSYGAWSANSVAWLGVFIDLKKIKSGAPTDPDGYMFVDPGLGKIGEWLRIDPASPVAAGSTTLREFTYLPGPTVRCWGSPGRASVSPGVTIFDLDPGKGLSTIRQYAVPLPSQSYCNEAVVSPDGQRIACIIGEEVVPLWRSILGKINPRWRGGSSTKVSIWVSRFDGSCLREVGHIADSTVVRTASNIQWNADGHSVSFDCEGKRYSAEVGR